MDFYMVDRPAAGDKPHAVIGIRVHNCTVSGLPNFSIAGNVVYTQNKDAGECEDEPCGALEFKDMNGNFKLFYYPLDSFPQKDKFYRTQIHERERNREIFFWVAEWLGETWDRTPDPDVRIGSYGWISEWTLENLTPVIYMPDLASSRIGFCYCNGKNNSRIDADHIATDVWNY